jgi:hypothetical protein
MPFDIATARVSDECGALKILLDHWWFRRHIWVTRSRGDLVSIDGLTEVLYDTMHGDLGPRYQHYLQMRCRHEVGGYQGRCRKCSEAKIPSMRGKLEILIVLSESAVKEELASKSKEPNSSSRGYVDFFAEMGTDHKCQCLWELQKKSMISSASRIWAVRSTGLSWFTQELITRCQSEHIKILKCSSSRPPFIPHKYSHLVLLLYHFL